MSIAIVTAFLSTIWAKIIGIILMIFGIFMSGALFNKGKQKKKDAKRDMTDLKEQYQLDAKIGEMNEKEIVSAIARKFGLGK